MTLPNAVIVLSTYPADQDAIVALAEALVGEGLVACVNILPAMVSVYRWEGRVEHAREHQLVMKTTARRLAALKARLADLHPYDVPELLVLPVADGGADYLRWLQDNA